MARRRKQGRGRRTLIVALALALIGVAVWQYLQRHPGSWPAWKLATTPHAGDAPAVAADAPDPANEGRRVRVAGVLRASAPARDRELGISVDAPVLLRTVQMRQWLERCDAQQCHYALGWADQPVDSSRFRDPAGHANAAAWPLRSARFVAGELRLGAFVVDPALLPRDAPGTPWPVTLAQLPPNLVASFRSEGGELLTGDPARPAVGDLRVRFAVVAGGPLALSGVQRGGRLVAGP